MWRRDCFALRQSSLCKSSMQCLSHRSYSGFLATILPTMSENTKQMQGMEVWGGNRPVDSCVIMAGLDAWVYSQPHGGGEGGGDVHYVSSCAAGMVTRLLVADVAGHGQSVAETASRLRA